MSKRKGKQVSDSADPSEAPEPGSTTSFAVRMARNLYRIGLLLIVIGTLVIFRSVLLPFAFAILLAYLLFPIIGRLEKIPFGSWHPPRWLAIITVYVAIFTLGWFTVPGAVASLATEVITLGDTVPTILADIQKRRADLQEGLESRLEVNELNNTHEKNLRVALSELREGEQLVLVTPLPPNSKDLEANGEEAGAKTPYGGAPPGLQLFAINFYLSRSDDRPRASLTWPPIRESSDDPIAPNGDDGAGVNESPGSESGSGSEPAQLEPDEQQPDDEQPDEERPDDERHDELNEDAEEGAHPGQGVADPPPAEDEESEGPEEEPKRFDQEAHSAFITALVERIDEGLKPKGPAAGVPEQVPGWIDELNAEFLKLPVDDREFNKFKEIARTEVETAIAQEQYAQRVMENLAQSMQAGGEWVMEQLKQSFNLIFAISRGVFDFFLVLMLCAFFMIFFPRIRDYLRELVPPQYREDYHRILSRVDIRLSGAVRGQVIICFVNGFLTYPGVLWIGRYMDAPRLQSFAILLSVVAGILSLIPIFGVILSTVPMVLIAVTQSLLAAVAVIAWICVIHAIEAYILNPNILGHSAKMNPILVVFALVAGKQVGGLVGALLAVPVASVLVAMFGYYRRRVTQAYAAEGTGQVSDQDWGD